MRVRPLTLNKLVVLLLKRIKTIIVVCLIGACVAGGIGAVKGLYTYQNKDAQKQANDLYIESMNSYNKEIAQLKKDKDKLQQDQENLTEYQEKSIYFNLDSYHKATKEIIFYIETDYKIMPELFYQNPDKTEKIIDAYVNTYKNNQLYSILSDTIGTEDIEAKYLDEIISITRVGTNSSVTKIEACFGDESTATKLADQTFEFMKKIVTEAMGPHNTIVMSESCHNGIDDSLRLSQLQKAEEMDALKFSIEDKEVELSKKEKNEPKETIMSKRHIFSQSILYAVLGGVLGGVLILLWLLLHFVIDNTLMTISDVEDYYEFAVLARCSQLNSKKNPVENLISRLENTKTIETSDETVAQIVSSNIRIAFPNEITAKKFLITSTLEPQLLRPIVEALAIILDDKVEYIYSENILLTPKTVDIIPTIDGIILIEKLGVSISAIVDKEVRFINQKGKAIIGMVLV